MKGGNPYIQFFHIRYIVHIFSLQPLDVLRSLKDNLVSEKLSTAESGKAFIEMLRTFRNAGKLTIEEVLTNSDSYYIV